MSAWPMHEDIVSFSDQHPGTSADAWHRECRALLDALAAERKLSDALVDAFAGTGWPCDCHGHHSCIRHAALDAHEEARRG